MYGKRTQDLTQRTLSSQRWITLSNKVILDYNTKYNMWVNMDISNGKCTNLCRRIPDNLCRYSSLKEVELTSPLLNYGT